jgi:FMNH2-dependent dimethyl sulfone monooxygenase
MNNITPIPLAAEPVSFAYWVPNVSGGLVVSKIPQRTHWSLEYNVKLAQIAEEVGFDYALSQIRFIGSYGAEYQHESTTFSAALLAHTKRLKVIAAILPGPWHPAVVAKLGATTDQLFGGRWAVNVVSGWFAGEYEALGLPWLEHDARYRRSREFIQIMKGIWTQTSPSRESSSASTISRSSQSRCSTRILRCSRAATRAPHKKTRAPSPTGIS